VAGGAGGDVDEVAADRGAAGFGLTWVTWASFGGMERADLG